MRKLILASVIVLLSTSAFAGGSRSLSSSSAPLVSPAPQVTAPQPQIASSQSQVVAPPPQIVELPKPVRRAEVTVLPAPTEQPAVTTPVAAPQTVEDKLKAAGELRQDGSPTRTTQPEAQAQVQPSPAPAQARLASAPAQATAPTASRRVAHAQKPGRQHVVHRRESTEHKARRFAARFGIYW